MGKDTRKTRKAIQTIPQLRKAFDHIEKIAKQGVSVETFQKEWAKVFSHEIDAGAAESFLQFHNKSKKGKTRKMKQKGGSLPLPLAGAPLDYTTRPGTYESPYGSFLEYISSGFNFYDKINQDSFVPTQCGKENITPQLAASMGSNKVGGGKTRRRQRGGAFPSLSEFATALTFRPISSTAPTSVLQDAQTAFKGQILPPSPSPVDGSPPYQAYPATAATLPNYDITRSLSSELK
jgi:hypothetical protein